MNNYKVYGDFVRLTVGGGTAFYAGNNPLNRTGGGNLGIDYSLDGFANIANPIERDRALRDAAVSYIVQNPQRFAELAALKFLRIWRLWPVHEAYRTTAAVAVLVAVAGAGASACRPGPLRELGSPAPAFAGAVIRNWLHSGPYDSGWHNPLSACAGAVPDHFGRCRRQLSGPLFCVGEPQKRMTANDALTTFSHFYLARPENSQAFH